MAENQRLTVGHPVNEPLEGPIIDWVLADPPSLKYYCVEQESTFRWKKYKLNLSTC